MKKAILSAIAIASLQLAQAQQAQKVANATPSNQEQQQKATPEQLATREAARIQKEVQLTDDQRQKVYQAALTKHQALQPLKQKYSGSPEAMKSEAKPIKQQYRKDLSTILTPEQQEKLKKLREQNMQAHPQE